MLTLLDRYIARRILHDTLVVLAAVAALLIFLSVIDALGDYGKANFGLYALIRYVLLTQPRQLYELAPIIALIGTMVGLSTLAIGAELTAMRAAGVSVARIVGAALKVGLVFALVALAVGEYVVPPAESLARLGRARALARGLAESSSGIWLRDGPSFVNVGEVLPDLTLRRVDIYRFDRADHVAEQIHARRAVYDRGRWRLIGVHDSEIMPDSVAIHDVPFRYWHSVLTPNVVKVFTVEPESLSIVYLYRYIRHLAMNNQDTTHFELVLWQKILQPLATAVMVLVGTPFVFRLGRSGGLSLRVFVGIMLGLAFVAASRGFGFLGLLYGLPPFWGALLPIAAFFLAAMLLLRRAGLGY